MKYFLPLSPYHQNLSEYWETSGRGAKENFWTWVEQEYNATVTRWKRPEVWKFENEQDMLWFKLRWS